MECAPHSPNLVAPQQLLRARSIGHKSIEFSNRIHSDPSLENVQGVLDEANAFFTDKYSNMSPESAQLTAARRARGVVARVLSHRVAMNLAPLVADLLSGDNSQVKEVVNDDPFVSVIRPASVGIRTDFGRVWYGDDARVLAVGGLLALSNVEKTVPMLPDSLKLAMPQAGAKVTNAAKEIVKKRGLEDKLAGAVVNRRISQQPRNHLISQDGKKPPKWQESLMIDAWAASTFMGDLAFLNQSAESSQEHIVSIISDVYRGFWEFPEATAEDITCALIAHIGLFTDLAAMPNFLNGVAEYQDRYLESTSESGAIISARVPMVHVVKDPDGVYGIVRNPESAFAKAKKTELNMCPGPEAITPLGSEVGASQKLRNVIVAMLTGRYGKDVLKQFDRHFSSVDILAVFAIAVTRVLVESKFVSFSPEDLVRNLKPAHKIVSAGPYPIERRE